MPAITPAVWDMTLSWNAMFRDAVTLPRYKAAGFDVVGLSVGSDRPEAGRLARESIAAVHETVAQNPDSFLIVRTTEDVRRAQREGKLALELHFQGTGPLEGDVGQIGYFHELGVRHMGLVWNDENLAGSSATRGVDKGLTAYGATLVKEMNRIGVIVDGAHTSYRTTMDAMEICEAPFIISHGNVEALASSYKNLKDDQIKACAATGGVIGISGLGTYLDDLKATPEALFRQIDYVAELVGPQHVGLGLDFVTDEPRFWELVKQHPEIWPGPDGGSMAQSGFFAPEGIRPLRALLQQAGYKDEEVAGILGENWFRVCKACWR
jgi:membrane dipeptidase